MSIGTGKIQPEMNDIGKTFSAGLETQGKQETRPRAIGNPVYDNEKPQIPPYEQYRHISKSDLPPRIYFGAWRPYNKGEKVYPHHTELINGQLYVPVRLYGAGKEKVVFENKR